MDRFAIPSSDRSVLLQTVRSDSEAIALESHKQHQIKAYSVSNSSKILSNRLLASLAIFIYRKLTTSPTA